MKFIYKLYITRKLIEIVYMYFLFGMYKRL